MHAAHNALSNAAVERLPFIVAVNKRDKMTLREDSRLS